MPYFAGWIVLCKNLPLRAGRSSPRKSSGSAWPQDALQRLCWFADYYTNSLERLMKGLDEFLERDRDRELFDLAPKETPDGNLG